jgi:hypothetical protein
LDYWQLTLATCVYLGSVILAILGILTHGKARVHLAEFARLREDLKHLAEDVKQLLNAEQRRFLKELRSSKTEEDGISRLSLVKSSGPDTTI